MEKRVNFLEDMDVSPDDFNNLQGYAQDGLDHVVADAVTAERRYAGFEAVATNVTTLTVQPGRLYSGGQRYASDVEFSKDFTVSLPVATRKLVALVVFGVEEDTDQTVREFLLNEETGASEARPTAITRARLANVNTVVGVEAADPVLPNIAGGAVLVATILLTPAGIASVTMNEENRLQSVEDVDQRLVDVEAFRDTAQPQIASLGSDIAALTEGQSRLVAKESYGRLLSRVAVIESKQGIPSAAIDSYNDFFLDTRGSDTAFAGYSAEIREGLRFPDAASAVTALAIFNPLNPAARVNGGMLFPAYTRKLRQSVGPATGSVQVSQYSYAENNLVQKSVSRIAITYGTRKAYTGTYGNWWQAGTYDPVSGLFRVAGELWHVDSFETIRGVEYVRATECWIDTYEEPYWDVVTTNSVVNGTQIAETFLQANDMWLEAIGLTFTNLAADGAITIAICETDRGLPLLDKVISKTTVDRADLAVGKTIIPLQPVFLTGGKRYALVVITAADHWLGTVTGNAFPAGTMFYVLDSAYQQGDATRDLAFDLYGCDFGTARAVIDLAPLQLDGGISDLNIIAPAIAPGSTQLTFEIQVAGVWYPLGKTGGSVLGAGGVVPPLLPFRAVFTGSPDMMPALALTGSQVTASRGAAAFTWISGIRALPGAGSAQIRIVARLEGFDAADHTAVVKLMTGAGYATETAASSVVDVEVDGGAIERTWVFNLGAAVTSFRAKATGTAASALQPFYVAWRRDYAL